MSGAVFYAQVAWYYAGAAALQFSDLVEHAFASAPCSPWLIYGLIVAPPVAYLCWFGYTTFRRMRIAGVVAAPVPEPVCIVAGGVCACRDLVHDAENVFSVWPGEPEWVLVCEGSAVVCVADPAAFCAAATAAWGTRWAEVHRGGRVSVPTLARVSAIVTTADPAEHMHVKSGVLYVTDAADVATLARELK